METTNPSHGSLRIAIFSLPFPFVPFDLAHPLRSCSAWLNCSIRRRTRIFFFVKHFGQVCSATIRSFISGVKGGGIVLCNAKSYYDCVLQFVTFYDYDLCDGYNLVIILVQYRNLSLFGL